MRRRLLPLVLLSVVVVVGAAAALAMTGAGLLAGTLELFSLLAVLQAWYLVGAGLRTLAIRVLPQRWLPIWMSPEPRTEGS
ncbi:MAG: hypothetical protein NW223_20885 [Hyphomicrobiaceae bacterium]|nr:hypothetical protein [Hyphomicrobiaceae bacterium]